MSIVEMCVYTTKSYDTLLALTTYSGSLFAPKIFFALVCFPGGYAMQSRHDLRPEQKIVGTLRYTPNYGYFTSPDSDEMIKI